MLPVLVSAPVAFGLFTTTPFYVILKKTSGCDIFKRRLRYAENITC